jgi:NAD(P)-dependent dehydrogenase (short-subunit alcohol dehydrogenase family)
MTDLQNKVALVTGGGRGIGRAAALELARCGADVAVAARSRGEIDHVAAEIERLGRRAQAFVVDLGQRDAAKQLVDQVTSALGPISILVNNAGIVGPYGPSWEINPDEWEQALRINLAAPFRLAHAVLPGMIERGWGRIINVSSGAARNPMERAGAYSTSKAGLDVFTQQLGIELEGTGVAAVSIHPGVVDTVMQTEIREQPADVVGQGMATRFRGYYESGRLQQPDRPGRLIAALAGEAGMRYNGKIVDMYTGEAEQLIGDEGEGTWGV